jgi:hypothetical protein
MISYSANNFIKSAMHTLLVELTDNKAFEELHNLESKHLIRIVNENKLGLSYALPGEPVSVDDFRKWIAYAEKTPTVSLNQAKQQWQVQKEKLLQLTK